MSITTTESKNGTVDIHLDEKFTFDSHKALREAYQNRKEGTHYVIDFGNTDYMDSSALGMLLVMREMNGEVEHSIRLKNCKENIKNIFSIANFGEMFDIE